MLTDEQRLHQAIIISEPMSTALHKAFVDSLEAVSPKLQAMHITDFDMFGVVTHLLAHLIGNKCASLQEMTGELIAEEMINRIHTVALDFLKDFININSDMDKPKGVKA